MTRDPPCWHCSSEREAHSRRVYKVAVVGSPNVGKSTLFTRLTREVAHIANWPGTTVEKKEGLLRLPHAEIVLVDTPGVYSLSGVSVEEEVTRSYLLKGDWDAVLVLVDSLAPERTLYLALHVLEVTRRAVVALTKWDAAHARGIHVRVDELESTLGVPVVPVSAVTGEGLDTLVRALVKVLEGGSREPLRLDYGALESLIEELGEELQGLQLNVRASSRWLALKLLEGDDFTISALKESGALHLLERAGELRARAQATGLDPEQLTIMARYSYVDSLCRKAVVRLEVEGGLGVLERLLLSPTVGPALSTALLLSLYLAVFSLNSGFPITTILGALGFGELAERMEGYTLAGLISGLFDAIAASSGLLGLPETLASLLIEGVLPGLSLVASFLPLILTALLILAFLEDSGIGPYTAASLHRALQHLGVSGRAIYPMLISLGCNVPAVMSVRTLPEEVERRQLHAAIPFVPCQARLVVLLAFASAYFAGEPLLAAGALLFAYAASLSLFALTSKLVRRLYGACERPELLIELPLIHRPSLRVLWWITWDYTKHYLARAGVIIFGLSLVLWGLVHWGPTGLTSDPSASFASSIGRVLSPLLAPLGLDGAAAEAVAFALVAGFVAKETVILALASLLGSSNPLEALASLELSRAQALSLMVLVSAYMPCAATAATVYRESGSVKTAVVIAAWSAVSALLLSYATHALLSIS